MNQKVKCTAWLLTLLLLEKHENIPPCSDLHCDTVWKGYNSYYTQVQRSFFILHDNQLISVPGFKLFKLLTLALLRCSNSSCWKPSSLCGLSYSWCSFSFVRNCWKFIHLQLKINQVSVDWNTSLGKWFKAEPNLIAVTLCYPMSKMQLLYMVTCLFWFSFRQNFWTVPLKCEYTKNRKRSFNKMK